MQRYYRAIAMRSAALLACGGILCVFPICYRLSPDPAFEQVRASFVSSEAKLLDRNGAVLQVSRSNYRDRKLDWTELAQISPALLQAVVSAEDRRFFEHGGLDLFALLRVPFEVLRGAKGRGASTITMQVVALLDERLRASSQRRSLFQKGWQILKAIRLEWYWTKSEILEAYLNLAPFRGELSGVAAAAAGLFAKTPSGLNQSEAWILAALIRAPSASVEQVTRRVCQMALSKAGNADCTQNQGVLRAALPRNPAISQASTLAPELARRLIPKGKSLSIVSTLDRPLQELAISVLRRQLEALRRHNVGDGAILIAHNRSGEVLAYVGNTGRLASRQFVDGVMAPRQAGSTLKPFLYGLAFERKLLTAASVLDDSPVEFPVYGGMYKPKNYDNVFRGPVTASTALASSLNLPAVRTIVLLGAESFAACLRDFGFSHLREAETYGYSLALGSGDVTLWELVNAYRTLANAGVWTPLKLTPLEAVTSRQVLSPQSVYIVNNILSSREGRSATFGLDSVLATPFWTAVKTGTSKDMTDNWAVGFSRDYTIGVWVGNFSGAPMWNVSGVSGAAPIWSELMLSLPREGAATQQEPPAGLRYEGAWFIEGTEPVRSAAAVGEVFRDPQISYPVNDMVIALDPDIPAGAQSVFFESTPASKDLKWVLNGESVGTAEADFLWPPRAGQHALALVDKAGMIRDSLRFEVRG